MSDAQALALGLLMSPAVCYAFYDLTRITIDYVLGFYSGRAYV